VDAGWHAQRLRDRCGGDLTLHALRRLTACHTVANRAEGKHHQPEAENKRGVYHGGAATAVTVLHGLADRSTRGDLAAELGDEMQRKPCVSK
jgi:hypothetical protein